MTENALSDSENELSPKLLDDVDKIMAAHKETLVLSTSARTAFHEKLTVVTAGSLTIVATMATSIYIKPLADKTTTHRLLVLLAISSVLFFISLIASVIHNFLETEALHRETLADVEGTTRKMVSAIIREVLDEKIDTQTRTKVTQLIQRHVDSKFASDQATLLNKAARFRVIERGVGTLSVIFFIAGYMPAIIFVICLART